MKNPPAPAPAFDEKTAIATPPKRHDATARTYAFVQPATAGQSHLFSATGVFIATGPTPVPVAASASKPTPPAAP